MPPWLRVVVRVSILRTARHRMEPSVRTAPRPIARTATAPWMACRPTVVTLRRRVLRKRSQPRQKRSFPRQWEVVLPRRLRHVRKNRVHREMLPSVPRKVSVRLPTNVRLLTPRASRRPAGSSCESPVRHRRATARRRAMSRPRRSSHRFARFATRDRRKRPNRHDPPPSAMSIGFRRSPDSSAPLAMT